MKNRSGILSKAILIFTIFLMLSLIVAVCGLGYFQKRTVNIDKSGVEEIIDRFTTTPASTAAITTPMPVTGADVTTSVPVTTAPVTNTRQIFTPAVCEGLFSDRSVISISERTDLWKRLTSDIPAASAHSGASLLHVGSYDPDSCLFVRTDQTYTQQFSEGEQTVQILTRVENADDASYSTCVTPTLIARPALQVYMSFLLYTHLDESGAQITSLYDENGVLLMDSIGDKTPAMMRDFQNAPVYTDESGKFYALRVTEKDGQKSASFEKVGREKLRVGLTYDYPATPVAVLNGTWEVAYYQNGGYYRFVNYKKNLSVLSRSYSFAFNFDEQGRAVCISTVSDALTVINTKGSTILHAHDSSWTDIAAGRGHNYVIFRWVMPDTFGLESMGCQGFDHGWLRVRCQAISQMSNSLGRIVTDNDILVNEKGESFDIPSGYTLEGYSDGVLLLKRNGLYGYYSINGYWIAQPIYSYAHPFVQGLAVFGFENGTKGMIDTEGNIVLPPVFTSVSDVSGGTVVTFCEGIGWEVYRVVSENTESSEK